MGCRGPEVAPLLGADGGKGVFGESTYPRPATVGRKMSMAEVQGGGCVGRHGVVFVVNIGVGELSARSPMSLKPGDMGHPRFIVSLAF
jgi:hypothetical protein